VPSSAQQTWLVLQTRAQNDQIRATNLKIINQPQAPIGG
jgi:hypothetical protein